MPRRAPYTEEKDILAIIEETESNLVELKNQMRFLYNSAAAKRSSSNVQRSMPSSKRIRLFCQQLSKTKAQQEEDLYKIFEDQEQEVFSVQLELEQTKTDLDKAQRELFQAKMDIRTKDQEIERLKNSNSNLTSEYMAFLNRLDGVHEQNKRAAMDLGINIAVRKEPQEVNKELEAQIKEEADELYQRSSPASPPHASCSHW